LGNNVVGADCVEFKPVENPKMLDEAGSPAPSRGMGGSHRKHVRPPEQLSDLNAKPYFGLVHSGQKNL